MTVCCKPAPGWAWLSRPRGLRRCGRGARGVRAPRPRCRRLSRRTSGCRADRWVPPAIGGLADGQQAPHTEHEHEHHGWVHVLVLPRSPACPSGRGPASRIRPGLPWSPDGFRALGHASESVSRPRRPCAAAPRHTGDRSPHDRATRERHRPGPHLCFAAPGRHHLAGPRSLTRGMPRPCVRDGGPLRQHRRHPSATLVEMTRCQALGTVREEQSRGHPQLSDETPAGSGPP